MTVDNKHIAIGIVAIGMVTLWLVWKTGIPSGAPPTTQELIGNNRAALAWWKKQIQLKGEAAAYAELKQRFADQHFGLQHTAAHIFGTALFESSGMDALGICDETFAFGCYHGFFSKAIAENGEGMLPAFDAACIKKFGKNLQSCQHGLGHALLEYYGHGGLVRALEACKTLSWQEPLFGCAGGVFMEYNFPVLLDGDSAAQSIRQLSPDDPYAPCPALPEKFRQACYYEMGQWWEKVYDKEYQKIGMLCLNLRTEEERRACFRGVGNVIAPTSEYTVDLTITACNLMPTVFGRDLCLIDAANSFRANPAYARRASGVCDALKGEAKTSCEN